MMGIVTSQQICKSNMWFARKYHNPFEGIFLRNKYIQVILKILAFLHCYNIQRDYIKNRLYMPDIWKKSWLHWKHPRILRTHERWRPSNPKSIPTKNHSTNLFIQLVFILLFYFDICLHSHSLLLSKWNKKVCEIKQN